MLLVLAIVVAAIVLVSFLQLDEGECIRLKDVYLLALVGNDTSLCELITSECKFPEENITVSRDNCILEVARISDRFLLCSEIHNKDLQEECRQHFIQRDMSFCNEKPGIPQLNCISNLAVTKGDPTLCKMLLDISRINDCVKRTLDNVRDIISCKKFEVANDRRSCIQKIAANTKDSSVCGEIDNNLQKDSCIFDVAVSSGNRSLCAGIGDFSIRGECRGATSKCGTASSKLDRDTCLDLEAKRYLNPSMCAEISSSKKADTCLMDIYYQTKDHTLCELVRTQTKKDACKYFVGLTTWEPAICEEIDSQKYMDQCFKRIAEYKYDSSLCARVVDNALRIECENKSADPVNVGNVTPKTGFSDIICKGLNENADCADFSEPYEKDKCFYCMYVGGRMEAHACDELQFEQFKGRCFSAVAVNLGDANVCSRVEGGLLRDSCINQVAVASGDTLLCNDITDTNTRKYCFERASPKRKTLAFCERIDDLAVRDECFKDVAKDRMDYLICDRIRTPKWSDECNLMRAVSARDPDECDKLSDPDIRDSCLLSIGMETLNVNICLDIKNKNRDLCLKIVALNIKDKSICEKIIDEETRQYCIRDA